MKKMLSTTLLAVSLTLTFASCGDTIIQQPTAPTPPPVVVTPVVIRNMIEFRVVGNATLARVRYSDPIDGLTQTVTSLPFIADLVTTQNTIFLSLDVTPISFPLINQAPFLSAQIIVNGFLFREATTTDTTFNTLSVSGTWRASQ